MSIDPSVVNVAESDGRLERICSGDLPQHIAIIMDGNGRWARRRGRPRTDGHRRGLATAERIAEFVGEELSIGYLTLFAFSTENWKRPPHEVRYLMDLITEFLEAKLGKLSAKGVRLRVLGEIEALPEPVRHQVRRAMALTAGNARFHLNIAFNYGGRQEILRAVRRIVLDKLEGRLNGESIDEALFKRYLYTADLPDPDLVIRTSGEERVSNFLLWQIAYAEFWVTETLWPDFTPETLLEAIEAYQCRERKFGAVGEP